VEVDDRVCNTRDLEQVIPRVDRAEQHSFLADPLDESAVVVDLGMCAGRFASAITRRYGCRVVGAEPVPEYFRRLPVSDQIVARQVALGGQDGTARLYLNRFGDPTLLPSLAETGSGTITVPAETLDTFIAEARLAHVDLLKVDIEGAETSMFSHASEQTLANIDQISVEFHDFINAGQEEAVWATDRRLRSAGFRRIRFSRDNTDVLYVSKRVWPRLLPLLPTVIWFKYVHGSVRIARRKVWCVAYRSRGP
jgi:FkbM family methyltransferase